MIKREEHYERIMTCELCGQQFVITNKHNRRTKRCPECRRQITGCRIAEAAAIKPESPRHVSRLNALAREARQRGISYGHYMALKRMGRI